MSNKSPIASHDEDGQDVVTIPFRKKSNDREAFQALFREGMALVEATANYLDGPGRRESKCLKPYIALAYATESMRLTTRLTQLATWLLARRAVLNGDPVPQTSKGLNPLELPPISKVPGSRGHEQLPVRLKELTEETFRLHRKLSAFDGMISAFDETGEGSEKLNPVASQLAQLSAAFA
jgi:regulator of CtrA degradation